MGLAPLIMVQLKAERRPVMCIPRVNLNAVYVWLHSQTKGTLHCKTAGQFASLRFGFKKLDRSTIRRSVDHHLQLGRASVSKYT